MANFHWTHASEDLHRRYHENVLGYREWRYLIQMINEFGGEEQSDPFLDAFDNFRYQIGLIDTRPNFCRMFISHQRADVGFAERIAYLSHKQGFEYWLDVHDPLLHVATQSSLNATVKSVLIAAIIEMALLNCTHIITVQTNGAQNSRWIPYEFGRAKQCWLLSTQTASWFDKGVYAASTSDYLKLGVCALSEQQVIRWLIHERTRCNCYPNALENWAGGTTFPLPN